MPVDITATLADCTHLLDDRDRLEAFFHAEGYLLLRGVFPTDLAAELCAQVIAGLEAQGALRTGSDQNQIQLPDADIDVNALQQGIDLPLLWNNEALKDFAAFLLGGPTFTWRSVVFRTIARGRDATRAVPHQDGYFSDVNHDFRTFWTPLAPVTRETGGLAVVPRSHLGGMAATVLSESRMSNGGTFNPDKDDPTVQRNDRFRTIAPELMNGEWATAGDLQPGDLIVQHPYLIHEGRPNESDSGHLRLSMDFRVQPERSPRAPASLFTVPQFRDHLISDEQGKWHIRAERDAGLDSG